MGKDIFSLGEAEFLTLATTFNAGAVAHAKLLGIPTALVTDNTAKLADYTAAYHAAKAPNAGKIDRKDRKEKRDALTQNIRKIKNAYLDADPLGKVTPKILLDFGLPPKDATRTDVPDPTKVVPWSQANTCTSSPRPPAALQRRGRLLQSGRKRPRNRRG
jgi:hypothetical protein